VLELHAQNYAAITVRMQQTKIEFDPGLSSKQLIKSAYKI